MSAGSSRPTERRIMSSREADSRELLGTELDMGGRGRVDHQRLGVADIGQVRGQRAALDEAGARRAAALDPEADDRAGAAGQQALGERVVGVARQARVDDPGDRRVRAQEVEHHRACWRRAAPCAAAGSRCPAGGRRRSAGSGRRRSRAGPRCGRGRRRPAGRSCPRRSGRHSRDRARSGSGSGPRPASRSGRHRPGCRRSRRRARPATWSASGRRGRRRGRTAGTDAA